MEHTVLVLLRSSKDLTKAFNPYNDFKDYYIILDYMINSYETGQVIISNHTHMTRIDLQEGDSVKLFVKPKTSYVTTQDNKKIFIKECTIDKEYNKFLILVVFLLLE